MILNVLLIVGGLIFLIATGVCLFELSRAPLGDEDECGFHSREKPNPVRPGNFEPVGASRYSRPAPNAPLSVH